MIDQVVQELVNHRKIDLSKISRDYHRYPLFRLRRNVYGKKSELIPKDELYYIYITCNCSEKETALFFNVLENNVRHDLTLYNIKKDITAGKMLLRETVGSVIFKFTRDEIKRLCIDNNLTAKEVCKKLNITFKQMKLLIRHYSLQKPKKLYEINAQRNRKRHGSSVSKGEIAWLDDCEVPERYRQFKISEDDNSRTYILDAFIPLEKIAYAYLGDFWHGNPKYYKGNEINPVSKKRYIDLYYKTIREFTTFVEAGVQVFYIWDSEYKRNFTLTKSGKIRRYYCGRFFTKGDLI